MANRPTGPGFRIDAVTNLEPPRRGVGLLRQTLSKLVTGQSFEVVSRGTVYPYDPTTLASEPKQATPSALPAFRIVERSHASRPARPLWEGLDLTGSKRLTNLHAVLGDMQVQAPRSCQLTAQMNALIARGALTVAQADRVRGELLTSPAYASSRDGQRGMNAHWRMGANLGAVATAVRRVTGEEAKYTYLHGNSASAENLIGYIGHGFIVAVGTPEHAWTFLRPAEEPDTVAAINPYGPEYTLLFPVDDDNTLTGILTYLQQTPSMDATIY